MKNCPFNIIRIGCHQSSKVFQGESDPFHIIFLMKTYCLCQGYEVLTYVIRQNSSGKILLDHVNYGARSFNYGILQVLRFVVGKLENQQG